MLLRAVIVVLLLVAPLAWADEAAPAIALDFAVSPPVIDVGPSAEPRARKDSTDPNGEWFTLAIQNRSGAPTARVLTAADPASSALSPMPLAGRPALVEAASADPSIVITREVAFGRNAFRVQVPSGHSGSVALHLENASARPPLLAWTEPALIANNREAAVLAGLVSGLLTAALGFAAGAAAISSRMFPRWAALFLAAILVAELTAIGVFDGASLAVNGPYALFSLGLALAMAAGIRLIDYVAPFEAFVRRAPQWRDGAALGILVIGIAADFGVPGTGLLLRLLALVGAAAAAGYLAHCGRIGIAAARRLAPAATVFALVTAAAAFNALGFFGVNIVASMAIGGFSAAGALLVALNTTVPVEHSIARLREFEAAHGHDDHQASLTDEAFDQVRELAAVAASHQGVFDYDFARGVLSLSEEGAALVGLLPEAVELAREAWLRRVHPEDRAVYEEALSSYRHHPGTAFRVEFRIQPPGGRTLWCELRATMTGQGPEAERCLGLIADVTARKMLDTAGTSDEMDKLTGLGNRAALQVQLLESSAQRGRALLAVFDLDRFKAVNDSLGRDGADVALAAFVERLESTFITERTSGRLALFRVGGDMFAGLGFDLGDPEAFGRKLLTVTDAPFEIADREVYLSASAGVAPGSEAEDGQDLLSRAEFAMVEAKRQGGGRVVLYSNRSRVGTSRDSVALDTGLRHALERGEIEVHYQPIVRLADHEIAGFEALLRWRHPARGLVEPDAFVPHAEESGLILPLGRFVLENAVRDLTQWQRLQKSRSPLFVSVNVTWRQIADKSFAGEVAALLAGASIPRRSLKFEITESAVMHGAGVAETALQRLRGLGVGLAVDDFGTGHSSLSHLRRFPFEGIKIDKSFIADAHERSGAAILRSIVSLAHELKLAVVAEGLETEVEAALLREMGCEYGQGFLFGQAVPAATVAEFVTGRMANSG